MADREGTNDSESEWGWECMRVKLDGEAESWMRVRVCLVELILGRMEKKGEKTFWKVFGWEGEKGKWWWGLDVFSLDPPKNSLSKIGRKLSGRSLIDKWQKCPCALAHGLSSTLLSLSLSFPFLLIYFVFFFFFRHDFFFSRHDFYFLINLGDCFFFFWSLFFFVLIGYHFLIRVYE